MVGDSTLPPNIYEFLPGDMALNKRIFRISSVPAEIQTLCLAINTYHCLIHWTVSVRNEKSLRRAARYVQFKSPIRTKMIIAQLLLCKLSMPNLIDICLYINSSPTFCTILLDLLINTPTCFGLNCWPSSGSLYSLLVFREPSLTCAAYVSTYTVEFPHEIKLLLWSLNVTILKSALC